MIEILSRIAYLVALVFAPRLPSPDPTGADAFTALLGVVALTAPVGLAVWLMRRFEVLEAKAAVALFALADIALYYGASNSLSAGTPLLRAYYLAAPPLWAGVGAVLATLAGQYLGVSFKNKRTGAFVVTVAIGIFVFRDANDFIAKPDDQWREALARDPSHERALTARAGAIVSNAEDAQVLRGCLARKPASCICRTLGAERALYAEHAQLFDQAQAQGALAELDRGTCTGHPMAARADGVRAVALALLGRIEDAEAIVGPGLAKAPADAKLLYARALVLQQKDPGALDAARDAMTHGAGAGSELLVAMLLIETNDLAGAKSALKTYLEKHPGDATALYDAALVADRLHDYNAAREGYLKTLKLDPKFADARYNLAVLTYGAGATDEAKHHAQKFAQAFPEDSRKFYLLHLVGLQ